MPVATIESAIVYQTSSARAKASCKSFCRLPESWPWLGLASVAAQPRKVSLGAPVDLLRSVKAACASLAGYISKLRRGSDSCARHLAGHELRSIRRVQNE